jgi:signal transduction histidine kinase
MGLQLEQNRDVEPDSDRADPKGREAGELAGDDGRLVAARERVASLESSLEIQARAHADLIHLLSHELRTPITVISGFTRLLMDPAGDSISDRQLGFLSESLKACRRLNALVNDLLAASPDSGFSFSVEPKPGDLNATIYSMLSSLSPLWAGKQMQVEVDLDPDIPEVHFDSARIEQVLTNLLTNAIRYGRSDGTVRVGSIRCVDPGEPVVEVYVEDDGPGIPVADRVRVFEPYVRRDCGTVDSGLGIGLAICQSIIASHAGSIRVDEGSLGGARFKFRLPIVASESQE